MSGLTGRELMQFRILGCVVHNPGVRKHAALTEASLAEIVDYLRALRVLSCPYLLRRLPDWPRSFSCRTLYLLRYLQALRSRRSLPAAAAWSSAHESWTSRDLLLGSYGRIRSIATKTVRSQCAPWQQRPPVLPCERRARRPPSCSRGHRGTRRARQGNHLAVASLDREPGLTTSDGGCSTSNGYVQVIFGFDEKAISTERHWPGSFFCPRRSRCIYNSLFLEMSLSVGCVGRAPCCIAP